MATAFIANLNYDHCTFEFLVMIIGQKVTQNL